MELCNWLKEPPLSSLRSLGSGFRAYARSHGGNLLDELRSSLIVDTLEKGTGFIQGDGLFGSCFVGFGALRMFPTFEVQVVSKVQINKGQQSFYTEALGLGIY